MLFGRSRAPFKSRTGRQSDQHALPYGLQDEIVRHLFALPLGLEVPRELDKVNPCLWKVGLGGADHLSEAAGNMLARVGNVRGKQPKTERLLHDFVKGGCDNILYENALSLVQKIVKVPVEGLAKFDQLHL
jgi:hypothetical protein